MPARPTTSRSRPGGEDVVGDVRGRADDQRVGADDGRQQLVGDRARAHVDLVTGGAQAVETAVGDLFGDQDPRHGWEGTVVVRERGRRQRHPGAGRRPPSWLPSRTMFDQVWGTASPVVETALLRAVQHAGGYVAAAYVDGLTRRCQLRVPRQPPRRAGAAQPRHRRPARRSSGTGAGRALKRPPAGMGGSARPGAG